MKNETVPETVRYKNFWHGKKPKRTSNYDGLVFLTRKDKRIHDSQYLKKRPKQRRYGPRYYTTSLGQHGSMPIPTRRAKAIKREGDRL